MNIFKNTLGTILILLSFISYSQIFEETKQEANQEYVKAQYNLGVMYYDGIGTPVNKSLAAKWIKQAYENGFEEANVFWEDNELWNY